MSIEEFQELQSQMSNEELVELCEKEISNLCKTGGQSIHMQVPPSINDTDMLFCELINRFKKLVDNERVANIVTIGVDQVSHEVTISSIIHDMKLAKMNKSVVVVCGDKDQESVMKMLSSLKENNPELLNPIALTCMPDLPPIQIQSYFDYSKKGHEPPYKYHK